jgi:hypothetical protein
LCWCCTLNFLQLAKTADVFYADVVRCIKTSRVYAPPGQLDFGAGRLSSKKLAQTLHKQQQFGNNSDCKTDRNLG